MSLHLKHQAARAELSAVKEWNESLTAANRDRDKQIIDASNRLASVSARLDIVSAENQNLRAQAEQQKKRVIRAAGARLGLSHLLDDARERVDEAYDKIDQKKNRILELLTRIRTLESELSNTHADKTALSRYFDALGTKESRVYIGNLQKDRTLETSPKFRHAWDEFLSYAEESGCPSVPIILCGWPKSGNTMLRFFYHNLVNVTNNGASDTLTHNRLNEIQRNYEFPFPLLEGTFRPPVNFSYGNFPLLFSTHRAWEPFWNSLGKVVFIYRNPLDTMISWWYQEVHFDKSARGSIPIDDFSLREIHPWIQNYKAYRLGADVSVRYEDMMLRPHETFQKTLVSLEVEYDEEDLETAVEVSKLSSIRKMEDANNTPHGPHYYNPLFHTEQPPAWFEEDGVRFTRSGKIGQWNTELNSNTIERIHALLEEEGIDQSDFIFDDAEADIETG